MELPGASVAITGAGAGIGAALARRFAALGANVVVADIDGQAAAAVAAEVGGIAVEADAGSEDDVVRMVDAATEEFGPIDLICLNAGVATAGGIEAPDDAWREAWDVNVMAHVYGVRAVLPAMLARGSGYLLHTASAAGLLTNLGAAPYTVTKHAVVALAEWLSVTYGDAGITVSCLCPQFVDTAMLDSLTAVSEDFQAYARSGSVTPDAVADAVVAGLSAGRFLILPHPEVGDFVRRKADDHERWLAGMRRLQHRLDADPI